MCVCWLSAWSTALHGLQALTAVSKPLVSAYRPSTPPHTYRHPSASSLFSTFICSPQAQVLVLLYWYLHTIMTTSVIQCLQWTTENQKKQHVININNSLCLVFWQFVKVIHKFTHTHILPWYNCNGWLSVKHQVTYTHSHTVVQRVKTDEGRNCSKE